MIPRMDTNTKNTKRSKRQYSHRWGIPTDTNFTIVYETFLRHYHQVQWITDDGQCGRGIANTDMMVLIHLSQFKFESPNSIASPALDTIATRMGMTRRNLIYHIQCLERKNLLGVHRRRGRSSIYDLTPFARSIQSLAASDGIDTSDNNLTGGGEDIYTAPVKKISPEKELNDDDDDDDDDFNVIQVVAASQTIREEREAEAQEVDIDPLQDVWAETLVMLSGQMTRATFNTHLHNTTLTADNDGYIIQCATASTCDWLDHRLRQQVVTALMSSLQLNGLIAEDEQPQIRFAIRSSGSDPSGLDTGDNAEPPAAVAVPVR